MKLKLLEHVLKFCLGNMGAPGASRTIVVPRILTNDRMIGATMFAFDEKAILPKNLLVVSLFKLVNNKIRGKFSTIRVICNG